MTSPSVNFKHEDLIFLMSRGSDPIVDSSKYTRHVLFLNKYSHKTYFRDDKGQYIKKEDDGQEIVITDEEIDTLNTSYYQECAKRKLNSLHLACIKGDLELVQAAIAKGYKLNKASCNVHNNRVNLFAREEEVPYGTPLIIAAKKNHSEVAKILLDAGAKVNYTPDKWPSNDYQTPVMQACCYGSVDTLRILVEYGADIDLTNSY